MQTRPLPLRTAPAAVSSLVALTLLGGGCSGGSTGGSVSPVPAVNAAAAPALPTDVMALPLVSVSQFHDLLSSLAGTPVVLNIWASWCSPCKAEAPLLEAAVRSYGDRVQFLGVDMQDSRDGAREFATRYRMTYPSVFDPQGSIITDLKHVGPPVTLFYGADGSLVRSVDGQIGPDTLGEGIRAILS
jgi:cytochrome c biogenesis protein CcmG/thiol:disulfide interchange protein DsbE